MNVVKELMGHASITTTAEFYSKVCAEHEAMAQRVGEELLAGAEMSRKAAKHGNRERYTLKIVDRPLNRIPYPAGRLVLRVMPDQQATLTENHSDPSCLCNIGFVNYTLFKLARSRADAKAPDSLRRLRSDRSISIANGYIMRASVMRSASLSSAEMAAIAEQVRSRAK